MERPLNSAIASEDNVGQMIQGRDNQEDSRLLQVNT